MTSRVSMSGMPSRASPFLCTIRNTNAFSVLSYFIFTLHMPFCVIVVLLYYLRPTFLLLDAAKCSFVYLRKYNFEKNMGWHYIFIPACISFAWYYCIIIDLLMLLNFTTINNYLLLKQIELIFTILMWFSVVFSCAILCIVPLWLLLLLHTTLKWFVFSQLTHISPLS